MHRTKHKRKEYPPSREGLDMLLADVKLMCDNCRLYNEGSTDLEEMADEMEAFAKEAAEQAWQGAERLGMGLSRHSAR
jgi:hypothetical protein